MRYIIQLKISMSVEYDGDHPDFYFEEHKCVDDLIEQLAQEVRDATDRKTCTCHRASIKLLGPANEVF